jgi:hypothetical protein
LERGNAALALHLDAAGRQDRGDAHEILLLDVRIAQRQFEGGKPLAVNADAMGQKEAFRDTQHGLDPS